MNTAYSVAVYLIDRRYGGPEEGGWYFNTGELADEGAEHLRMFTDEDAAQDYADSLNDGPIIAELNQGRPDIHSVLSCGQFRAVVMEGYPRDWPETRPFYE